MAEAVMDKAGAIPGLLHAIMPAVVEGKLGNMKQVMRYCAAEPKGQALWEAYERSGHSDPCNFIIIQASVAAGDTSLAKIIVMSNNVNADISVFMEAAMKADNGDTPATRARAILEVTELERFIARDQFEYVVSGLARRLEDVDSESALQYIIGLAVNVAECH